jgi:hypothetical protein
MSLMERLNYDYLGGKDNCPKTLDKAVDLLMYNQDHSIRALQSIVAKGFGAGTESSFAQKGKNGSSTTATTSRRTVLTATKPMMMTRPGKQRKGKAVST